MTMIISLRQKRDPDFKHMYAYLHRQILPEDPLIARCLLMESEIYLLRDRVLYRISMNIMILKCKWLFFWITLIRSWKRIITLP